MLMRRTMGIIRDACRFTSEEIDALLKLDKKMHETVVYGISHTRRRVRGILRKASVVLDQVAEYD